MNQQATAAELFEHSKWVLSLARQLVGEAGADDVAQQTMQAALRRPPQVGQPLEPWLSRVTRRFASKWSRGTTRRLRHEAGASALRSAVVPSAAELVESADLLHQLVRELSKLAPPLREVVTLRFMHDLSSREIGERLNLPAGTVRWRLSQGLDELRARMDTHCDGDRPKWTQALAAVAVAGATARRTASLAPLVAASAIAAMLLVGGAFVFAPSAERPAPSTAAPLAGASQIADAQPVTVIETAPDERRLVASGVALRAALSYPTLPPGTGGVHLRIVDAAGAAPGATVTWPDGLDVFARTNATGHAWLVLRPPADRTRVRLHVRTSHRSTMRLDAIVQLGEWQDLGTVETPRSGRLTGRVLDDNKRPIEGAVVLLTHAELPQPIASYRQLGPPSPSDLVIEPVFTDISGAFELPEAPELPVRLWAVTPTHCFATGEVLRPSADRTTATGDLVLEPLPAGSSLRGRVVDVAGHAVVSARVRRKAMIPSTDDPAGVLRSQWFNVGPDGRFEMPARVGVNFELLIEAVGFAAQETFGVRAGADVEVVLLADR